MLTMWHRHIEGQDHLDSGPRYGGLTPFPINNFLFFLLQVPFPINNKMYQAIQKNQLFYFLSCSFPLPKEYEFYIADY